MKKTIILMRHGKAANYADYSNDFDRPLTPKGESDVLEMGIQKELAANLDYRDKEGEGDAESFMRDYFTHATRIRHISADIFHRCLEVKPTLQNILTQLQQTPLESGFLIKKNKLLWYSVWS